MSQPQTLHSNDHHRWLVNDIIDQIIDHLADTINDESSVVDDDINPRSFATARAIQRCMVSSSLVCRAFVAESQKQLFRDIRIRIGEAPVQRRQRVIAGERNREPSPLGGTMSSVEFMDLMTRCPRLASHVKFLGVEDLGMEIQPDPLLPDITGMLPNIQSISVGCAPVYGGRAAPFRMDSIRGPFSDPKFREAFKRAVEGGKVKFVTLRRQEFSMDDLVSLFEPSPTSNLEALALQCVGIRPVEGPTTSHIDSQRHRSQIRIQSLTLEIRTAVEWDLFRESLLNPQSPFDMHSLKELRVNLCFCHPSSAPHMPLIRDLITNPQPPTPASRQRHATQCLENLYFQVCGAFR